MQRLWDGKSSRPQIRWSALQNKWNIHKSWIWYVEYIALCLNLYSLKPRRPRVNSGSKCQRIRNPFQHQIQCTGIVENTVQLPLPAILININLCREHFINNLSDTDSTIRNRYSPTEKMTIEKMCFQNTSAAAKRTVAESLDRKTDSEPATGHWFCCIKHDFAVSKDYESVDRTMFLIE
jgi:hypothetical protein